MKISIALANEDFMMLSILVAGASLGLDRIENTGTIEII